jgi:Phosphotransferase enzyme family
MDTADAAALLMPLLTAAGLDLDPVREPIRIWARSGVERLRLADGGTVVFKYAQEPFDREHLALALAARGGLPVPRLLAARTAPGLLGMLMEDLGPPVREAGDQDAAEAAVLLHRVPAAEAGWLPRLTEAALAGLPARIAERATRLRLPGRIAATAGLIAQDAERLTAGAELPPFGLCHSEFHPTSLHIGPGGWRLLDFARAFTGPGLLDLASWPGTVTPPDPHTVAALITGYVKAGGPHEAAAPRGNLPPQCWALGWHRVWISDWYTEQIERGWAGHEVHAWTDTITRHLREAAALLVT